MSIRKQYDTDLESLKNSLTEMGRNSADAVENALEALCVADADAAAAIVKGDARINNMERDIEHRCMTLLLRQQPVAGDLRRISTAMKVVTDIERIGDHAADIAEIIPHLVTVRKEGDPAVSQAIAMGKKAHQMILDALDALTAEDENAARRVIAADDEVDYDFNAIKHQLAQEIAEDPGKVDAALDLLMVIKYLERIGDHALIQGGALLGQDAPPFVIVRNDTMRFAGINKIGLSRRGFTPERIGEIHDACRILFQSGLNYMSGCEEVEKQVPQSKERDELVKFIRESKRGIIKPYESVSKEE